MTRAAIYCRISNDPSGRAAGVERQEPECRELVAARGWDLAEVFTDNDVRATARRRPAFDALMEAIGDGRVNAVVAWKDDRLLRGGRSRWAHEFLTTIRDHRTSVVFVQGDDWNFATAQGRLLVELWLSIAGYEVEQAGERQAARWRQRKRDGKLATLGRRPFGLQRRGDRLVHVPAEVRAIRSAARKLIEGQSLYRVTADLGMPTSYGNAWRPQHLKRALLSDHLVTWGVLDADTHRLVAAKLNRAPKKGPGRPRREYALSGLARCGLCGSKLAASSGAFHCQDSTCGKVGVLASYLDQTVFDQLADHVEEERFAPEPTPRLDDAPILGELAAVEDRITELREALAQPGTPVAVLAEAVGDAEARRDALTEQLGREREPGTGLGWLRRWVGAGLPALMPEDKEWLATVIERVDVAPAKVRGARFDPERVTVQWREDAAIKTA